MRISILSIGAIASVLTINSVLATSSTVTSKDYVDAQDALKQNKIPATGTNASTPGDTVVTYTDTAGTIGERGICNDPDEDDCNDGDLVTNSLLNSAMDWVAGELESATNLPETTVTYKTCYQEVNGECILWNLTDKNVYGRCHSETDCTWLDCSNNPNGEYYMCSNNGQCECVGGR
ncbi:MAG: hypothetical protein IJQ90_05010 [Alphaproteobacteria bacterium]|nr:hypothetical protein [Alphaproteobacteria bacterium]